MKVVFTRLNESDVDDHIANLIVLGEDPKTIRFWDRVRVFIASLAGIGERIRLLHWWLKRKEESLGR